MWLSASVSENTFIVFHLEVVRGLLNAIGAEWECGCSVVEMLSMEESKKTSFANLKSRSVLEMLSMEGSKRKKFAKSEVM